jgi:hypothetical protein
MFELFVASDAARRKIREGFEPQAAKPPKPERPRRRAAVRSTSAAALRGLADRLEPTTS